MNQEEPFVQQALADLALVRRALDRAELGSESTAATASGTSFFIQVVALILALIVLVAELSSGNIASTSLIFSKDNPTLRVLGATQIGLLLCLLMAVLYFLVWCGAKTAEMPLSRFIARNFSYLGNLSFMSDLFVKYSIFVALLFAGAPELIAPIFLIFIGDYLIQGRLFTLPLRSSLLLGICCIAGAGLQYYFGSVLLVWPLLAFTVISSASLTYLYLLKNCKPESEPTD